MAKRVSRKFTEDIAIQSAAERVRHWLQWNEDLMREVLTLVQIDSIFWPMEAIIKSNPELYADVFLDTLREQYERSMLVGIRALSDEDKDSRSVIRLLDEMRNHSETTLTRE